MPAFIQCCKPGAPRWGLAEGIPDQGSFGRLAPKAKLPAVDTELGLCFQSPLVFIPAWHQQRDLGGLLRNHLNRMVEGTREAGYPRCSLNLCPATSYLRKVPVSQPGMLPDVGISGAETGPRQAEVDPSIETGTRMAT